MRVIIQDTDIITRVSIDMISRVHVTVESDLAETKWVENRLHDWHSLLEVANTVRGRVVGSWEALRQKRSVWRMIGP